MIQHTGDGSLLCGPHGLAVLDAFSRPITVQDAMIRLRGRSAGVSENHVMLLDDDDRTSRFIRAIESTVRPDDIVLDREFVPIDLCNDVRSDRRTSDSGR